MPPGVLARRGDSKVKGFVALLLLSLIFSSSLTAPLSAAVTKSNNLESSGRIANAKADVTAPIPLQFLPGAIQVGDRPSGVAFNPMTNMVYVASKGSGSVSAIDATTNRVIASIKVPDATYVGIAPS